jgi:hypothetical protein
MSRASLTRSEKLSQLLVEAKGLAKSELDTEDAMVVATLVNAMASLEVAEQTASASKLTNLNAGLARRN